MMPVLVLLVGAGFAIAGVVVLIRRERIAAANLETVNRTGRRVGKPTTVGAVVFLGAGWVLVGLIGVVIGFSRLTA